MKKLMIVVILIFFLVYPNKKEKEIERKSNYNLVNDGETGEQIKTVKSNGYQSAHSSVGSNSFYCKKQ